MIKIPGGGTNPAQRKVGGKTTNIQNTEGKRQEDKLPTLSLRGQNKKKKKRTESEKLGKL